MISFKFWIVLILSLLVNLPFVVDIIDNMGQYNLQAAAYLLILTFGPEVMDSKPRATLLIALQLLIFLSLNVVGVIGAIFLVTGCFLNRKSIDFYNKNVFIAYGDNLLWNKELYPENSKVTKLDIVFTLLIFFSIVASYFMVGIPPPLSWL